MNSTVTISYNPYKIAFWAVLVIVGILFLLFFKGCFSPALTGQWRLAPAGTTITIVRDTASRPLVSASPIPAQPIIITTQPPTPAGTNTIREIIYKQDTAAIVAILTKYFSKNAYSNTLKIDTIGTVTVNDTISQNTIAGRSYTYDLKYPVITNTITNIIDHPYEARNQLYVGAGVMGNQIDLLTAFKAGILLKNKKDNVLEVNATVNKGLSLGAEIGYYKLISFRKK